MKLEKKRRQEKIEKKKTEKGRKRKEKREKKRKHKKEDALSLELTHQFSASTRFVFSGTTLISKN